MTVESMLPQTYTCASCHVVFQNGELHRAHYQSDWHRYNLRRKVSDLPPVTEIIFEQKRGILMNASADQQKATEKVTLECVACRKTFSSQNAHDNHLKSKKHLEAQSKPAKPIVESSTPKEVTQKMPQPQKEEEFLPEDATEEQIRMALEQRLSLAKRLRPEDCIFCNTSAESFEANMEHMTREHGLYIPDLDFIVDLPGLIQYLSDKVSVAFCCLYCSSKVQPFTSLESVRRHMRDKGHLKILFDEEGQDELADFYNYEEEPMEADDDSDFTDVSDEEGEYMDEEEGDWEYDENALIVSPDGNELVLPSGKRLVHRSLSHICKQNLVCRRSAEEDGGDRRMSRRGEHDRQQQQLIHRLSDYYLASGMIDESTMRRIKRDQRANFEDHKEWDVKTGTRNNMMQHHFRYQLRQ